MTVLALPCLLMARDDAGPWTNRSRLRDVKYRTDANLAARQTSYTCQHLWLDLPPPVRGGGGR